jgi:hypothetical protein
MPAPPDVVVFLAAPAEVGLEDAPNHAGSKWKTRTFFEMVADHLSGVLAKAAHAFVAVGSIERHALSGSIADHPEQRAHHVLELQIRSICLRQSPYLRPKPIWPARRMLEELCIFKTRAQAQNGCLVHPGARRELA